MPIFISILGRLLEDDILYKLKLSKIVTISTVAFKVESVAHKDIISFVQVRVRSSHSATLLPEQLRFGCHSGRQ